MARMRLTIAVVCVALAASLMMQRRMQAQSQVPAASLFVPILQATPDADLGLAFSNPTLDAATVTLTAHAYDGSRISGSGITNPATITLPGTGWRAQALDGTGAPRAEIPINNGQLHVGVQNPSLWYLLTR